MTLIREQDFGTKARPGPATVHVQVDGRDVEVPEGTSIMRAAATAGVDIPKLCATDSLDAFGSCRLCLVEVDGRRGTPAVVHDAVQRRACRSRPRPRRCSACAPASWSCTSATTRRTA